MLKGFSIFWVKINNLKKIEKKNGEQKKQLHHDEVKKKKKKNTWVEFCRLDEF